MVAAGRFSISEPLVGPLEASARRPLGRTDLLVSAVGLGTGPLGNLYSPVDPADAEATVRATFDAGLNHLDTAPLYGAGLAERRLASVLAERSRDEYVLSTKAGLLVAAGETSHESGELALFAASPGLRAVPDFSETGIRRSLAESLERLDLETADILYLHEPERAPERALAEALPVLVRLRAAGLVRAVGAGSADVSLLTRIVAETDVDVVLLAGGWTLLDQSAGDELLPLARERGTAIVLGGIFQGGLLLGQRDAFRYPWADRLRPRVEQVSRLARRHEVPLAGAAVRLALAHPAVSSVLIGVRTPGELRTDLEAISVDIPARFWEDMLQAGLLSPDML